MPDPVVEFGSYLTDPGERPAREERAQVPHAALGIGQVGAELDDRVGHRHRALQVRDEVGDQGLRHGRA